ncbi:MAG: UDP-N-acetylmuramoyl-tripeptide--D-alanyl-D-alanine ligase [bacterium]|nr:UDP-N-acetylmuramoyl-tripeptide--D-alanyl-D-alanine ligase [bacterium]
MAAHSEFRLGDILSVLGGRLICGDPELRFRGYCIDSRGVDDGVIFIPLMGQARDGHQYVIDSLGKGAVAALVRSGHHQLHEICGWAHERGRINRGAEPAVIEVRHTLVALQKLAEWWRMQHDAQVVGITGSVGKTGTKEILIQLLAPKLVTVGTEKNFNNEIGVPLALSRINAATEVAVIEMAMRARGEISLLSRIAHPNVALITSTAGSHVGRLGSFEEVYRAKAEIVDGLPNDGLIAFNLADPNVLNTTVEVQRRFRGKGLRLKYYDTTGVHRGSGIPPFSVPGAPELTSSELPAPNLWVEDMQLLGLAGSRFTLCTPNEREVIQLSMLGRGSAENVVSAAALALELGLSMQEIARASTELLAAPQRLNIHTPCDDLVIIDDCYNSSPASARDSLELMLSIDARYRRIVVLGDMLELGKYETLLHRQLAQVALNAPLSAVFAVGPRMNAVNEVEGRDDIELYYIEGSNGDGGMNSDWRREAGESSVILSDHAAQKLADSLMDELDDSDQPAVVLVKGSRGLHLERVISDLLARYEGS